MPADTATSISSTTDFIPLPAISTHIHVFNVRYRVSLLQRSQRGALVDRGANGGIAGEDCRVLLIHNKTVDVTGIDNHEVNGLKVVDIVAKVPTHAGPVIGVFHQYAYHGLGKTIHSAVQMEHYRIDVSERPIRAQEER